MDLYKNGGIVYPNGDEEYFLNGEYHREDGPARKFVNGNELWYLYGKHHRVGGPAVHYSNGTNMYYRYGKLHREDGPAVDPISMYGQIPEWYIDGVKLKCNDQKGFERLMRVKAFW